MPLIDGINAPGIVGALVEIREHKTGVPVSFRNPDLSASLSKVDVVRNIVRLRVVCVSPHQCELARDVFSTIRGG